MARKPNLLNRKRGVDPLRTRKAYLAGLQMQRIQMLRKTKANRIAMDAYWADRFALLFKP